MNDTQTVPGPLGQMQVDFATELGIGNLAPNEQEQIIVEVGQNIMKRIIVELMNLLPEDRKDEFVALSDSGDENQMMEFIAGAIPGVDEILKKIVREEIEISKNLLAL
jgi:hypothetical protein